MSFPAGALAELRTLVWRFRHSLVIGLALTVVDRLSPFTTPALLKVTIDQVVAHNRLTLIAPITVLAVVAIAIQAFASYASQRILGVTGQRAVAEMRAGLLVRILAFPISFFDSDKIGNLVSRIMTDSEQVDNLVGSGLVALLGASLTAVIGLGAMLYINWALTLAVLVVLAAFTLWGARTFSDLHGMFTSLSEANSRTTARLTETLGGINLIKAFAAERHETDALSVTIEQQYQSAAKTVLGVASLNIGTNVLNGIMAVMLIAAGSYAIARRTMTLGDLVAFIACANLVASPLLQVSTLSGVFGKAFAALARIHQLQNIPGEDVDNHLRLPLATFTGGVTLERVSYAYLPGQRVLDDIDIVARAGTTVALVGPSGSGKSTLCRLLLAFDRPCSGRILIDGRDLTTVRLHDYRARLGVVLQDNFLFDGTVRANIAFARPSADATEVMAASRIAHCEEFVSRLPSGYDTMVGERGVMLSGGQRQRVAIARAILADPRILILDEATSNLDSESEALIRDALRSLRAGRTTFVIAHRLSTIESADQILVLEAGHIVERGTHGAHGASGEVSTIARYAVRGRDFRDGIARTTPGAPAIVSEA